MSALLLLLGGGAAAVAATKIADGSPTPPPNNTTSSGGVPTSGGATPGATIGQMMTAPASVGTSVSTGTIRYYGRKAAEVTAAVSGDTGHVAQVKPAPATVSSSTPTGTAQATDPAIQQKVDQIVAGTKDAYDRMELWAREKGAKYLNEKFSLDPPLTGKESWDELTRRMSALAGSEAGKVIGETYGGPAGAYIGDLVGGYLGEKIEDLIAKNSDDIGNWFEDQWHTVSAKVESWADDAWQATSDYFGGLF